MSTRFSRELNQLPPTSSEQRARIASEEYKEKIKAIKDSTNAEEWERTRALLWENIYWICEKILTLDSLSTLEGVDDALVGMNSRGSVGEPNPVIESEPLPDLLESTLPQSEQNRSTNLANLDATEAEPLVGGQLPKSPRTPPTVEPQRGMKRSRSPTTPLSIRQNQLESNTDRMVEAVSRPEPSPTTPVNRRRAPPKPKIYWCPASDCSFLISQRKRIKDHLNLKREEGDERHISSLVGHWIHVIGEEFQASEDWDGRVERLLKGQELGRRKEQYQVDRPGQPLMASPNIAWFVQKYNQIPLIHPDHSRLYPYYDQRIPGQSRHDMPRSPHLQVPHPHGYQGEEHSSAQSYPTNVVVDPSIRHSWDQSHQVPMPDVNTIMRNEPPWTPVQRDDMSLTPQYAPQMISNNLRVPATTSSGPSSTHEQYASMPSHESGNLSVTTPSSKPYSHQYSNSYAQGTHLNRYRHGAAPSTGSWSQVWSDQNSNFKPGD